MLSMLLFFRSIHDAAYVKASYREYIAAVKVRF